MLFTKHRYASLLLLFVIALSVCSCSDYLDAKPSVSLAIPGTVADLQGLLDNYPHMNRSQPSYGVVSADEYYLEDEIWEAMSTEMDGKMYRWESSFRYDSPSNGWYNCYRRVFYANEVLERITTIEKDAENETQWNNVKGQAFFHRANAFLQLASIWALAYDDNDAETTLGIPLRATTDFNVIARRASNRATYEQILADLKASLPLLPGHPLHVIRPSKAAAYGLLARTCLFMRKYGLATAYADSCLQLTSRLMNYNQLDTAAAFPIEEFNPEVIWHARSGLSDPIQPGNLIVDTNLYASYDANDLRKAVFFEPGEGEGVGFRGSYAGEYYGFAGIAVDEVLLIRAEGLARSGEVSEALADLNRLLEHRYKTGAYEPFVANDPAIVLEKILRERKKELLLRGIRWADIKRQNKEGRNIVLQRVIKGQTYVLEPNDLRYALPIPQDVIDRSEVVQNPR